MPAVDGSHPSASFHFVVRIEGGDNDAGGFTEVSGIEAEIEVEDQATPFVRKIPGLQKYRNLTLKRGVVGANSDLRRWLQSSLEAALGDVQPARTVVLDLLDEAHQPLVRWRFLGARPMKWSQVAAGDNDILVEVLEIAYASFERSERK